MRETGAQEDLQRQRERRREDVLGRKDSAGRGRAYPKKNLPRPRAEGRGGTGVSVGKYRSTPMRGQPQNGVSP